MISVLLPVINSFLPSDDKTLECRVGDRAVWSLVDAVHAANPSADLHTGEIARRVADETGCHCIVARVSRTLADLNRAPDPSNVSAILDYRAAIRRLLEMSSLVSDGGLSRPFLHVAIHGMTDEHEYDIEVGTRNGETCSEDVAEWLMGELEAWAGAQEGHIRVVRDVRFIGDASKAFHRHGDATLGYGGYGPLFNTVQIEWARHLRAHRQNEVVGVLCRIVDKFGSVFPG